MHRPPNSGPAPADSGPGPTISGPAHTNTRPAPTNLAVTLARLTVVLLATGLALLLPATTANAANYQFWGYYQLTDGTWAFAQTGPDQTVPKDGSVEGWRWAVSEESGASPRTPRVTPAFSDVCGTTAAPSGQKRVAVVVDYGRPADGDGKTEPPPPLVKCATVATAATGSQVLSGVTDVRVEKSLVCGISGYPASGCGGQVATLSPEQKAADTPIEGLGAAPSPTQAATPISAPAVDTSSTSSGIPVGVWVGLVVVVLVVAALVYAGYRRRQTQV